MCPYSDRCILITNLLRQVYPQSYISLHGVLRNYADAGVTVVSVFNSIIVKKQWRYF